MNEVRSFYHYKTIKTQHTYVKYPKMLTHTQIHALTLTFTSKKFLVQENQLILLNDF